MIKEYFLKFVHQWRILLKDRTYVISLLAGLGILIGAYIIALLVTAYNDAHMYVSVGDFILDDVATYNLSYLYIWGFLAIIASTLAYGIFVKPEIAPFALKTFGILLLVRACFIVLTNLGLPQGSYYDYSVTGGFGFLSAFFFKNDLFFSGHTAVPFLAFLLYKESKIFKWVMLGASFVMGATVLLMHIHYSIDVFAAFFITHGIYALSNKIFNDLNVRFRRRIKLHGWNAMRKRLNSLRDRRRRKLGIPSGEEVEVL